MRQRKVDIELDCSANDLGFREFDQRCVNLKTLAFHAGFCSKVGQDLKCFDKFWPAIGIAAVIDRVYPEKNVIRQNHFRPGERVSEKDGVARGHVRDGDPVRDFFFRTLLGHSDIVGKRRAAEDAQVDLCDAMLSCA